MSSAGFATGPSKMPRVRRLAAALVFGLTFWSIAHGADEIAAASSPYRLAMTSSVFMAANPNDARSAMSVWISTLAKNLTIPVDSEPVMFENVDSVARSPDSDSIDGFGLTTEEFSRLRTSISFDMLATTSQGGKVTEEYVVLVRKESAIARLEDLRGQRLIFLTTSRTSLAAIWLDTLLLKLKLPPASIFFAPIIYNGKPSRVVLPVFFKQADACLVTRQGFEVMSEQNPQLGKQLRVLETSPELVPILFAFRADRRSPYRAEILEQMKNLRTSEAGRQILNFFQADGVVELPASQLTETLDLIAAHHVLLMAYSGAGPIVSAQTGPPP